MLEACGCWRIYHGGWSSRHAAGPHCAPWLRALPFSAYAAASRSSTGRAAAGRTTHLQSFVRFHVTFSDCQGVDLNLDQFDLSTPERFANAPSCSAALDSLEARMEWYEPGCISEINNTRGPGALGPGLFAGLARNGFQSRGQAALCKSLQGQFPVFQSLPFISLKGQFSNLLQPL